MNFQLTEERQMLQDGLRRYLGDAVTPEEQTYRLFEKAGQPKKLIVQKETSHYAAYNQYFDEVTPQIIDWYDRHLRYEKVETRE